MMLGTSAQAPLATSQRSVAASGVSRKKNKRRNRKLSVGTIVWRTFWVLIALLVGLLVALYVHTEIPNADSTPLPAPSTVYFSDGTTEIGNLTTPTRTPVAFADMGQALPQAVVQSQDPEFFTRPAQGITGVFAALWESVWGGSGANNTTLNDVFIKSTAATARGASHGVLHSKAVEGIRESLLAYKIDRTLSKEELVEAYLNTAYFGRDAYGAEAAAQAYFGVSAKDLSTAQAALLAAILPAPSAWDPAVDSAQAQQQFQIVVSALARSGTISEEEAAATVFPEVLPVAPAAYQGTHGYLLAMVRSELTTKVGLARAVVEQEPLRIVTTINAHMQQAAVDAVSALPADKPGNLMPALVSIEPSTGGIVALYGGADYATRSINNATEQRSPAGAPFKALGLIENFEQDHGWNSVYYHQWGGWVYGDRYPSVPELPRKLMSLSEGMQYNQDDIAVNIAGDAGTDMVLQRAITMGIPADAPGLDDAKANVLGNAHVTALEMARMYAALANSGKQAAVHIVQQVSSGSEEPFFTAEIEQTEVVSENAALLTTAQLQLPFQGDGVAAQRAADFVAQRQAAGLPSNLYSKTSSWFVGYTPQLSTAVSFVQLAEDGSLQELTAFGGIDNTWGNGHPESVWVQFMTAASADLPVENFPDATQAIKAATKVTATLPAQE